MRKLRRLELVACGPDRPRNGHGQARSINPRRITMVERAHFRALYPEASSIERPAVRADCVDGPRPCPFVGCRWHLYLDVNGQTGTIQLNFPGVDVEELTESCALDVADRGGTPLEGVGEAMAITRERVRQIEDRALDKLIQVDGFLDLIKEGIEA